MKLPRWLVIAMLTTSVLSVLAAAGWWWVTWPDRTIRDFKSLVAEGRFDEANAVIAKPEGTVTGAVALSGRYWKEHQGEELLHMDSPSLVDLIAGRRTCRIRPDVILTVQRSTMSAKNEEGGALVVSFE